MGLILDALKRLDKPGRPVSGENGSPSVATVARSGDRPQPVQEAWPVPQVVENTLDRIEMALNLASDTTWVEPSSATGAEPAVAEAPGQVANLPSFQPLEQLAHGPEERSLGKPPHEDNATTLACEPVAGPYQRLAEAILGQITPGRPAVLMFTSPSDDHGKTTMLAQLAPALAARIDGEVLLVDADFCHPALTAAFGMEASPGLPDVLEGRLLWSDAVRPTGLPRLGLLPGGWRAPTIIAPCLDADVARLLQELAGHYALVLMETASLAHPQSAPLAAGCDGAYLIAGLGQDSTRSVRRAARAIQRVGGRLLGCVAVEPCYPATPY